ncbi:MAG: BamA/TamA family outer membrane protein [SAR324 cluster bacterium]|nr:BamA/TamA family outer membrane protein [SAR324 cluster bacterium]MCZ6728829.1 BamA/TamA family outer membrane protein [SAR324 cluster bacterium]
MTVRVTALLLLLQLLAGAALAFPPQRRRVFDERPPNEYLLIPAVASLPGVGTFVGLIGSASNLGDSGIDAAATVAESIDGSDISVKAVAFREIGTGIPSLTLDLQYADIVLGNFNVFVPGRNSPNFTVPISAEFLFYLIRPTLRLFERRLTMAYSLLFFDGFDFDRDGNEIPFRQHSAVLEFALDFTDDVVDPRQGLRFNLDAGVSAPRSSFLGKDSETRSAFAGGETRLRRYGLTLYIPITAQLNLAWNNQYFETRGGSAEDVGGAISGGSPPLRGYPFNRWRDRVAVFHGLDLRFNIPLGIELDFLLARGIVEDLQLALFYEVGQVASSQNSTLYDDMRQSYGAGVRVLLQAIVLRLDLGLSEEGPQTHLTIGHSF